MAKSEKELVEEVDQVNGAMSRWWGKLQRAVTALGKLRARLRRVGKKLDALREERKARRRAKTSEPVGSDNKENI